MLHFDPSDLDGMRELMRNYGHTKTYVFGEQPNGDQTVTLISTDNICVETWALNGCKRKNIYWYDGATEESFEGYWR